LYRRGTLFDYYWTGVIIYFAAFGYGYLISVIFKDGLSQMACVVSIVIMFQYNGAKPPLSEVETSGSVLTVCNSWVMR